MRGVPGGAAGRVSFFPPSMHGTYTHRITCNLYPDQYFKISHAANRFHSRVAPFLRDTALAYLDRKALLPASLDSHLRGMGRRGVSRLIVRSPEFAVGRVAKFV